MVGDYATGHIKVFKKSWDLVDDQDTGLGRNALTGLTAGPGGELYALDAQPGRLLQVNIL